MANEISLVTASGRTVTPKDDGIIYEVFSPGNGIIYGGAVTIKDSSTLHITAGHGIVCGRKFTIDDSDIPVALSGSGSLLGRLYIHLDLADAADPITLLVETGESLTPVVQDADVNINNGVYENNIATFDVDTVTISNLVDVAPYLNTNGYEHEQINNALGNTDISGIGDGSVTGAISKLNADITPRKIATAPANQTFGAQLTYLQTAFNALSDAEKKRSFIRFFNGYYANYSCDFYDLHTGFQISSAEFQAWQISIPNAVARTYTNTAGIVNLTNEVVNSSLELWV